MQSLKGRDRQRPSSAYGKKDEAIVQCLAIFMNLCKICNRPFLQQVIVEELSHNLNESPI